MNKIKITYLPENRSQVLTVKGYFHHMFSFVVWFKDGSCIEYSNHNYSLEILN